MCKSIFRRKVSTFIHNNVVDGRNSVRRSPRANPKCVPACAPQSNKSVNNYRTEKAEARIDFKYSAKSDIQIDSHEADKQRQQQKQKHAPHADVIEQRHFVENTISNNQDNDEQLSQQQQQQQHSLSQKLQEKNHEENKLLPSRKTLTDHCCTVIYERAADVHDDCVRGQQTRQGQAGLIGDNPDVELMAASDSPSPPPVDVSNSNERDLQESQAKQTNSDDLTRISNHKVLVFGGIDPYCLHRQHVQQQQQQHQTFQKELETQQQQYSQHLQQELLQRRRVHSIDSIIMSTSTHLQPLRSQQMEACARTEPWSTNAGANKGMDNFGDHVLCYDIDGMSWRHLSHIPFGSRHHHAAVVCNGLIYVIGGTRTSFGCTKKSIFEKSVWCFNPKTLKWHLETNLPESRRDFAAIAIDSEIQPNANIRQHKTGFYVIGGESVNGKALRTVWFYNSERKLWSKQPSLNMGRYGLTAALVNNEIWVAGGIINDNKSHGETLNATPTHVITDTIETFNLNCHHCNDVLAYNRRKSVLDRGEAVVVGDASHGKIGTNFKIGKHLENQPATTAGHVAATEGQWIKSKHNLRLPRLFGRFCKMPNGQLYLVGGLTSNGQQKQMTSLAEIDIFNEKQQKWEHVGDLNLARHGHDVALLNDHCFVVIGGVSTVEHCAFNKVEAFCTKTRKSLKDLPALPWPVSGCAAIAMN